VAVAALIALRTLIPPWFLSEPIHLSPGMSDILTEVDTRGVAVITLNRPRRVNAVSLEMWTTLGSLFREFSGRRDIKSVVLTGAGGNFSAGADISEFAQNRLGAEAGTAYDEYYRGAVDAVRTCSKPVIAAVNGNCMGGACALAMASDFRIADASARFGIPASKLGVVYGMPECRLLFGLVGVSHAKRILYLGDPVSATEAERMGLVDRLIAGPVVPAAHALAEELAERAPLSIAGHKTILNALGEGVANARAEEFLNLVRAAVASRDYNEAVAAFGEKRKPVFQGK
jgi:enoyl-CoA hydratase/carnithine racemase